MQVSRFANVLKKKGVKKGDRVAIYLPMISELAVAMLACARIGAIHTIVFGGFSAEALRDRILDAGANCPGYRKRLLAFGQTRELEGERRYRLRSVREAGAQGEETWSSSKGFPTSKSR